MAADGLKELLEPFGPVKVKRMFRGHGVYAQDLCFAVESGGEVFLKVDARSQPDFSAAGSDIRGQYEPAGRHERGVRDNPRAVPRVIRLYEAVNNGNRTGQDKEKPESNPTAKLENQKGTTTPKTTMIRVETRPTLVSNSPAPRRASTSFRPYSKQDERLRERRHSSASMGSGAGRARAFTGRRRKLGTWSPSPITGASTSRRGRSRRGAGSANPEERGGEARS
jgi:hypothetical protein